MLGLELGVAQGQKPPTLQQQARYDVTALEQSGTHSSCKLCQGSYREG